MHLKEIYKKLKTKRMENDKSCKKSINREKKGMFNMRKVSIHQEDTTILNRFLIISQPFSIIAQSQ